MKRSLAGTDVPDELALWVGRFVMYFGYLEFQLWLWYNEVFDDKEKAAEFVVKILTKKAGVTKGALEKLELKTLDRKGLLDFLDRVITLAQSRNLVCHNPYFTLGDGEEERKNGAIFGIRKATIDPSSPIPNAKIADVRRFADEALTLCEESHRWFKVLQTGLPPRK